MAIHRIHLKGPWPYELRGSDTAQATGVVTMPAAWDSVFGVDTGTAVFRRRFHEPTNLDDDERVWLVFDAVGGQGAVNLNAVVVGHLVTSTQPQRLDVTDKLLPFNELVVELAYDARADGEPGGLHAPVAIEIESPD